MSEPARRLRPKPRPDLNWLHDRMEGQEGSVTLHWKKDSGFQGDKVDVRLFERVPDCHNKA